MASHTVLIGYGDTGRVAVAALPKYLRSLGVTVVDSDLDRTLLAAEDGVASVVGDGADRDVLGQAAVREAVQVIVTVADDMATMKIIAAVRLLNTDATIAVLLREERWRELAGHLGADHVVLADEVVGGLLGTSVSEPAAAPPRPADRSDLAVAERAVRDVEIGRSPRECGPSLLAVVRAGARIWLDDGAVRELRQDDRLLVLSIVAHG